MYIFRCIYYLNIYLIKDNLVIVAYMLDNFITSTIFLNTHDFVNYSIKKDAGVKFISMPFSLC